MSSSMHCILLHLLFSALNMLGVNVNYRVLSSLILLMIFSQNFGISNKKVLKILNSLKDDMDDVKMRITSIENKLDSCGQEGTNNVTESSENENSEMGMDLYDININIGV